MACAEEFIDAMPEGDQTRLGERGLQLSAGQRQRIALARAFLRDAPLLMLDEPTAHIDPFSVQQLQASLAALTANRTVIQVTHNPVVAAGAGRILTLADGRLSQQIAPVHSVAPAASILRPMPVAAAAAPATPEAAVTA